MNSRTTYSSPECEIVFLKSRGNFLLQTSQIDEWGEGNNYEF